VGKALDRRRFLRSAAVAGGVATFTNTDLQRASAATASPDGGLNLKNFGATGNGSTDDGPALQGALNALANAGGGTLNVPPGVYRIASSVNRDFLNTASSIIIEGAGSASQLAISAGASIAISIA